MKHAFIFLAVLLTTGAALGQQTETLADVLKQDSIAAASLPRLNSKITSYAVLDDEQEFVIAYYRATADNLLSWPLYISRLKKKTGRWENRELRDVKLVGRGTGTAWDGQAVDCIGSVLSVERYQGRYYLNLHFNPSAGCLLILSPNLQPEKTLPGGTEAFIAGYMLWAINTVHFADVHPEELWMYNPKSEKSQKIYPQANDGFRKDFSARLAKAVDRKKCMTNNWACDPERFSSELGNIEVNNDTKSFAFKVNFSAEGFESMQDVENSIEDYVYVYRLDPFGWREFSVNDLESEFGTDSPRDLLTPENLAKVFATAK